MIKAVVLLGPPGAGKGTQARALAQVLKASVVGMGDLLRREISNQTDLGCQVQACVESGQFLNDPRLVMEVLRIGLNKVDGDYVVLDGVPRDIEQAYLVQQALAEVDVQIIQVFLLETPFDIAKQRISTRYQCVDCGACFSEARSTCIHCGHTVERRCDDIEDIIERRLTIYHENVQKLVDYYKRQDLLSVVDATRSAHHITQDIVSGLASLKGGGGFY